MNFRSMILLTGACFASSTQACDSCAIAISSGETRTGIFVSLTEQFTHFGTLRLDGEAVANRAGQFLDSSITHLNLGFSDGNRLTWQATLPYVHRSFQRSEGGEIDRGAESGIGDATASMRYVFWRGARATRSWEIAALGGVKFATGSAHRLGEELNEVDDAGGEPSGIHGHDLALGSGSTDGLVGLDARWTFGRALLQGSAQYAFRSSGKYDYRFANELLWSASAGWFPLLTHSNSCALAAVLSGESKSRDTFAGEKAEDTGLRAVYLGPRVMWSGTDRWSADLEFAWPISQHNTALQAVADYRWRAGATWRF